MKNFLRIVSIALTLIFVFSNISIVEAASLSEPISISNEYSYYDEELNAHIIAFKKNIDGSLQYLTEEEVKVNNLDGSLSSSNNLLSINALNQKNNSLVVPNRAYYEWYKFTPTSYVYRTSGTRIKVSADVVGPPNGGSISVQVACTVNQKFSANVTLSTEKTAIQAGAGFEWVKTVSNNTTYTMNLQPGKTSYVAFTPYYNTIQGNLSLHSNWDGIIQTSSVTGYSPKKLSTGEADGLYMVVTY